MAKDYKKGDDFRLYLDTADDWSSPTWAEIKAFTDPSIDPGKGDIEVTPQASDAGHLQGNGNATISFTLLEDEGDSNVGTIITRSLSGAMTHLEVAAGDITTTGTKYWHMEACLFSSNSASRGDVSQFDIEAKQHANSDNELTRATAS